ncbi:MAG TPA: ABC transporter permease [Actinomycetaceae bacterium]|nr:ABC transporter permease [Actinomycetaceae bacterium]
MSTQEPDPREGTREEAPGAPAAAMTRGEEARTSIVREILSGSWLVTVFAIVFALLVGAILIAFSDPRVQETFGYVIARPGDFFGAVWDKVTRAYSALVRGAIFDWRATTFTRMIRPATESLVFATPLILAGLAIAIPFRAGLFNIGGQGQVIVGALFAGFVGYAVALPPVVHLLFALLGGLLGGAIYAGISGWLKARTGANEVIVTIMLNNIAGYLILYLLKQQWFTTSTSPLPQSPNVASTASLPGLLPDPFRINAGFLLAILVTFFVWWLMERSTLGFEFRAVGANPNAARTAGISVERVTILVMVVSGALAGLAGANQVLGTEQKLTPGIAGSLGFDAITVALLGRSRPVGVFFAGILFGALKAGGYVMQSQTNTPIDIILVVQSVIVLLVAAPPLVRSIFRLPAPGAPRKRSPKIAKTAEVTA